MEDAYKTLEATGILKKIPEDRHQFACKAFDDLFQLYELNQYNYDLADDIVLFAGSLSSIVSKTTSEFESIEIYQKWIDFKNLPNSQAIKDSCMMQNIDWECQMMYYFRERIIEELNGVIKNDI